MEKFYILGLTQEEVAGRALTQLADTIRSEFMESSQAVIKKKITNPKKEWAIIKFENLLESPDFEKKFKGFYIVLYLNQVAKDILEDKGLTLNIIGETQAIPDNAGTFISMPRFR